MPRRTPIVVALLAVLVLCLFGRALRYDLVWDDKSYIEKNGTFFRQTGLLDSFRVGYINRLPTAEFRSNYYRPLVTLSFLLENRLWGLRPWSLRLVNALLFFLALLFLYLLLRGRPDTSGFAEIAVLLVAANPLTVDNLVWVVGRCDLMMFLSIAAALFFLDRAEGRRRAPFLALSSLSFALGLLSKETTAFALPALLAYDWARRRRPSWAYDAVNVLATASFFWVKGHVLGIRTFHLVFYPSLLENARVLLSTLGYYVRALVWPFSYPRLLPVEDTSRPLYLVVGLAAAAALAVLAARALRRRALAVPLLVVAGFLAVHEALAFTTLLPFRLYARYMMVPAAAVVVMACAAAMRLKDDKVRNAIAVLLLVALIPATILKSMDYQDELTFFRATLKAAPRNDFLNYTVANAWYDRGEYLKADAALRRMMGLTMRRENAILVSLLSSSLDFLRADYPSCLRWLESVAGFERKYLEFAPFIQFQSAHQTALVLFARGEIAAAEDLFRRNIARYPNEARTYRELFNLYAGREDWARAGEVARLARERFGSMADALDAEALRAALAAADEKRRLKFYYLSRNYGRAIEIASAKPDSLERTLLLAQAQYRRGLPADAETTLDAWVSAHAGDVTTLNAIAGIYLNELLRVEQAERYFRASLAIDPRQVQVNMVLDAMARDFGTAPASASSPPPAATTR